MLNGIFLKRKPGRHQPSLTLTGFKNNRYGLYLKAEGMVQLVRVLLSKPRDLSANPRAHINQSYLALCVLVILAMRKGNKEMRGSCLSA